MIEWITSFIEEMRYIGVFLLMLLENIFPPIPSEFILPLCGLSIARGELDPVLLLLSGSSGSLAGAVFWYILARKINENKLEHFIKHHGPWLAITWEEYQNTLHFFEKHSNKAVFLARMVPTFRTLISVPAGLVKMPIGRFLAFTTLGTLIWSATLMYAGYTLKDEYEQISKYIGYIGNIIFAGIIILYLYKLIFSKKQKSKEK